VRITLACVALAVVVAAGWGTVASRRPVAPRGVSQPAPVDAAWYASLPRDPEAATAALIDRVPHDARARGDAFGDTRYVVLPLRIGILLASAALLLWSGAAAGLARWAQRATRFVWLQDAMVAAAALTVLFLLALPVETYAGFIRYRDASFSSATHSRWLADFALNWLILTLFTIVGIVAIVAMIRRWPRGWVGWASMVYIVLSATYTYIAPTYIEPRFNHLTPLADGPDKQRILSLARANGVPANDVYVRDASRQSVLLDAHVSGLGSSAQIVLDDNTIATTARPEVDMVMAHEIGHYALAHIGKGLVFDAIVIGFGFLVIGALLRPVLGRFGAAWGIGSLSSPAVVVVVWVLFSVWGFATLPVSTAITREQEAEADLYGLNASREPFGLAEFMLRDADTGRLDPPPLEEALLYTHPSPKNRILTAMRWRAEHMAR